MQTAGGRELKPNDPAPSRSYAAARSKRRLRALWNLPYILPALTILGFLYVYPLGYGLYLSMHEATRSGSTKFVGWSNFSQALLRDPIFHRALINTFIFTAAAIILQTGLGFLLAVLLASVRRGSVYRLIVFAPFVLSAVTAGAVWEYLFTPYLGPLSTIATRLGLEDPGYSILGDSHLVLVGILAAFLWRYLGFNVVVYLAGLKSLSHELYEAADLDGATWFGRIKHITWPLLMPQTFVLVVLTTIGTLQIFDLVWIMTQGGPGNASQTVGTYLYTTAFQYNDFGYAEAMAYILFAIIAVLAAFEMGFLRRRVERITS